MTTMYPLLLKLLFISFLTAIFLKYFGFPSLEKYQAHHTLIREEHVKFKADELPAITITTSGTKDKNWKHGWKGVDSLEIPDQLVETFCKKSEHLNATLNCIKGKTFKLSEMVKNAHSGYIDNTHPSLWQEDIFNFYYGKTFKLIISILYFFIMFH